MLEQLDLSQKLGKKEYQAAMAELLPRAGELQRLAKELKIPIIVAFEGWDAAGKGGNIKRVTERLDPRGYEVFPIAAPQGEDATHHYLYRFWRRLRPPDEKQVLIFDRSWYGRVLVERIEGFCTEAEWKRAYREINEFERQLVDFGMIMVKFWLHISSEEQLRRFEEREQILYKQWKLTDEDWRNRDKHPQYEAAVEDMLLKTSTVTAPWTVVEANDKWYARVKALRTLVETLSRELDHRSAEPGGKSSRNKRKK